MSECTTDKIVSIYNHKVLQCILNNNVSTDIYM